MKEPVKCPRCRIPVYIHVHEIATESGGIREAWVECPSCEMRGPLEALALSMTEEEAAVDAWNELFECTDSLQTENVRLRELVQDIWREGAFEPGANYATEAYGLAERTRELGIEVD